MNSGIFKFNFCIRILKTSSIFAKILRDAYLSKGVFWRLIITKLPPLRWVYIAISAAGLTLRLDPRETIKSALPPIKYPRNKFYISRLSPKLIMLSFKSPLHYGSSHFLPVLWSLNFEAVLTLKSLIYPLLHVSQISKFWFPWSSMILPEGIPLFRWSPSIF